MSEMLLTDEFKATLDLLPVNLRSRAMATIQRLRVDPGHPGLQVPDQERPRQMGMLC